MGRTAFSTQVALKSTGIWLSWKLSHGNDCRTVCNCPVYICRVYTCIYTQWSHPELSSSTYRPRKYLTLLINWKKKKYKAKSRFAFVILEHKSLFLLPESAVDSSQLLPVWYMAVVQAKEMHHEPLVCAYVCIHLFLYIHIHIYIHPHTPPSTHVCPHTHTHTHAWMHIKLLCYCSGLK